MNTDGSEREMRILEFVRAGYRRICKAIGKDAYTPRTYPEYLRSCGAQVGEGCFIASMHMEVGIEPYLLKIGNRVTIERDAAVMTHDGAAWVFRHQVPDLQVYGPVVIEDDCCIGRGALLCPNVRIGHGSIVEAESMVIANVPPNTVVIGVPARPVGSLSIDPRAIPRRKC